MSTMLKILTIMFKMENVDLIDHVFNFVDHSDLLKHGDHVDYDVIVTFTATIVDIDYLEGLMLFCQAQFQLASPVPVELRLALSLIITTPTPNHPGK